MPIYQTTPLAIDLYSRVMVTAFDELDIIGVPTGFQSIFGRPETGARTVFSPDANEIDIDIIRGNEKTAALIPRGMISRPLGQTQKNLNSQKFTNFNRVYPLSEEEGDLNATQITRRLAGEPAFAGKTQKERLQELAFREHKEQIRRTIRMFEILSAESLLTGKMSAILGTTDSSLQYNFLRHPDHSVDLMTPWTDPAADALGDIDDVWALGRTNGHVNYDYMVLGEASMNALLKNTDFIAKADNRRIEMILVSSTNPVPDRLAFLTNNGFTARGRIVTPNGHEFWMFTYSDIYNDSRTGDPVKYMPIEKVLFGASSARCDRYFGPPEWLPLTAQDRQWYLEMFGFNMDAPPMPPNIKNPGLINPGMFYCDAYGTNDRKKVSIRTQAAPIFATTMTDAFAVIENAGTPT